MEERRKKLQEILDAFVKEQISSKSLQKFLAPEYKIPLFCNKVSRKKSKYPITAVPYNSKHDSNDEGEDNPDKSIEEIAEQGIINFGTMQTQYLRYYKKAEEEKSKSKHKRNLSVPLNPKVNSYKTSLGYNIISCKSKQFQTCTK